MNLTLIPAIPLKKKPGLAKIYKKLRGNPDYRQLQLDLSNQLENLFEQLEFIEK